MAENWQSAQGAAKDESGNYVALINGNWVPVSSAAKNDKGEYMVLIDKQIEPQVEAQDGESAMEHFKAAVKRGHGSSLPNPIVKFGAEPLNKIAGTFIEPAMQMGSGYLGAAAGNLAAVGAMGANALTGEYKDPAQVKVSVQNALTYEPRTAGGKFVSQNVLAPIGGIIEAGAEKVASVTDNPYAQAGIKEATLQGVGLLGVKGSPKVTSALEGANAAKLSAMKELQSANRLKDAIRREGEKIGLYAPAERGIKQTLSHLGKAEPHMSVKNVITATNALAEEVGLPKGAISDVDMAARVKTLGADYGNVAKALPKQVSIPPTFKKQAQSMVDDLTKQYAENPAVFEDNLPVIKNLEEQIAVNQLSPDVLMQTVRRLRENSRNIEKRATKTIAEENLAKTNYEVANLYEDVIEQSLQGKTALLEKFRDSRMKLSKLHLIDSARLTGGLIDPQKLGTIIGKYGSNKKFVSGNLKTVADFANQFKDVMKPIEQSALPKVTGWELAGGLGGVAASATNPASLAFAIPALAKTVVPPLATRGMMQTTPNYGLSTARTMFPTVAGGTLAETAFSPYIKEEKP